MNTDNYYYYVYAANYAYYICVLFIVQLGRLGSMKALHGLCKLYKSIDMLYMMLEHD